MIYVNLIPTPRVWASLNHSHRPLALFQIICPAMATPTYPVATPLVYHCGICGSDLDDENSLFTSCGHFFCSKKGPNPCTKHAANTTGTCEQCETTCNFGALQRQGEGHSTRVRAYVFDDVAAKLRATAEILDVSVAKYRSGLFQLKLHGAGNSSDLSVKCTDFCECILPCDLCSLLPCFLSPCG